MNPTNSWPPLWGKSMARYLNGSAADSASVPPLASTPPAAVDHKILARLGLTGLDQLPSDPKLLFERLKADDGADASVDVEEFTRGIRRALRLGLAFQAKLHRHAGQRWTEWISEHFQAGYSCYQRYHVAAELQVGLLSRGLRLLMNENQARALAPFRRHKKFWPAVKDSFPCGFPTGQELRSRLPRALSLDPQPAISTPRIRLRRLLGRIARATPASDDPAVAQALALVRQAIAVLEKGAPT